MAKITIVFHSGYGHTAVVAKHVGIGAESVSGAEVKVIPVAEIDAHWETLENSDAIVFGAPTYMGSASAPFKEFMDNTSKPWFEQKWKDKIAAGFTNSGSPSGDKLAVLQQFAVFAAQHSMIWVGTGILTGTPDADGNKLNRLGSFLGLMTQAGNVAPEVEPNADDRASAEAFGKRVTETTVRWIRSKE